MAEQVTLRDYFDSRIKALEKSIKVASKTAERAVIKADAATEKRFDGVNEFRASLADSARLTMPRTECEGLIHALDARIDTIQSKIDQLGLRLNSRDDLGQGRKDVWAYIIAALGVLSALVMAIINVKRG
jgi:hypothetical protein